MLNLNFLDYVILENYFIDCFENIRSSISVVQSLNLAKHIFEKLRLGKLMISKVNEFLQELNKKYSFINQIVIDFERYINSVNEIISNSSDLSSEFTKNGNSVLNHVYILIILNLIYYINFIDF